MSLTIAAFVADGQVVSMAVTAFAARLDMLQRGGFRHDMLTANPARHDTMQLTGDGLVHLDAKVLQTAHEMDFAAYARGFSHCGVSRLWKG